MGTRGRILRSCAGCGRRTTGTRCPTCQPGGNYSSSEYQRNRIIVLANASECAHCGHPPTRNDPLTCDHILARVNGGTDSISNLRAVHSSCNSRLGAALVNGSGDA